MLKIGRKRWYPTTQGASWKVIQKGKDLCAALTKQIYYSTFRSFDISAHRTVVFQLIVIDAPGLFFIFYPGLRSLHSLTRGYWYSAPSGLFPNNNPISIGKLTNWHINQFIYCGNKNNFSHHQKRRRWDISVEKDDTQQHKAHLRRLNKEVRFYAPHWQGKLRIRHFGALIFRRIGQLYFFHPL